MGDEVNARIELSEEATRNFLAALEDESGPTPAMLELFKKHSEKPVRKVAKLKAYLTPQVKP